MGIVVEMPKKMVPLYEGGKVFQARKMSDVIESIEAKVYPDSTEQFKIVADVAKALGRMDSYTIEVMRNLKFHRI